MIPSKSKLVVIEARHQAIGLAATTWEQRQGYRDRNGARIEERAGIGMTAAELTRLMGPLHVNHPDFKGRDYTLNPQPNLTAVQPMYSGWYNAGIWAALKRACFTWRNYEG